MRFDAARDDLKFNVTEETEGGRGPCFTLNCGSRLHAFEHLKYADSAPVCVGMNDAKMLLNSSVYALHVFSKKL